MSRVLIAQLGARRHYAVPRGLHRAGILGTLVTDACSNIAPWRWLGILVPEYRRAKWLPRVMGRSVSGVPKEYIAGLPLFTVQLSPGPHRGERHTDYWARRNAAFCGAVVRRGFKNADTVYAFNGAALEIFQAAKRLGLRTVLDQTAASWRWNSHLLREEVARWPGWEDRPAELDCSGVLIEREEAEWELADTIICGSEFCRSTLIESRSSPMKCHVLQYPLSGDERTVRKRQNQGNPIRVLFAGTLQLRKGVQYLYQAAQQLASDRIEIRLVGPSLLSFEVREKLASYCDVRGAVPRSQMADHYGWADVFVLPTLSEGSANVCHEAMAAGLPVITTPAAGSLVRNGVDGLIVPERDVDALVNAIACMAASPGMRQIFGNSARARINGYRETELYANRLREIVSDGVTPFDAGTVSASYPCKPERT